MPVSADVDVILAVTATNSRDERIPVANYGSNEVDIAAPG